MELTKEQQETQEVLAKVLTEAWENENFKQDLIQFPEDAIKKLTGKSLKIKEGAKMVVVDQSEKDTFYLNIPASPNVDDIELTEDQLELVAGGGLGSWLRGRAREAAAVAVISIDILTAGLE